MSQDTKSVKKTETKNFKLIAPPDEPKRNKNKSAMFYVKYGLLGSIFGVIFYKFFYAIKNFREDAFDNGIEVRPWTDVIWMCVSGMLHIVSIYFWTKILTI
jgi:hypothetical protein